jgi:hypothetical protein
LLPTFFWVPFAPKPKEAISATFATATTTANTYNK